MLGSLDVKDMIKWCGEFMFRKVTALFIGLVMVAQVAAAASPNGIITGSVQELFSCPADEICVSLFSSPVTGTLALIGEKNTRIKVNGKVRVLRAKKLLKIPVIRGGFKKRVAPARYEVAWVRDQGEFLRIIIKEASDTSVKVLAGKTATLNVVVAAADTYHTM